MLPKKLGERLEARKQENALRSLPEGTDLIDFSSNDYLGFSKNINLFQRATSLCKKANCEYSGATGSRLLSGNHELYALAETKIANFHNTEDAIIFNSGYDANIGFFSSVPQRGDLVLYDALIHASIRDGIRMGAAKAFKYAHNNIEDIKEIVGRVKEEYSEIYVVTESIFSMDGDTPDLDALCALCAEYNLHLVVDEAHAVGVVGIAGVGMVQELGLQRGVFARVVTFGKALGCHGAAILGSSALKKYLINFARSVIYTTGLPPHSVATILASYEQLEFHIPTTSGERSHPLLLQLRGHIQFFKSKLEEHKIADHFVESNAAIQSCLVSGNDRVKQLSMVLQAEGFDVKPILAPTVRQGEERLRICLHSYNTKLQIEKLISLIAKYVS